MKILHAGAWAGALVAATLAAWQLNLHDHLNLRVLQQGHEAFHHALMQQPLAVTAAFLLLFVLVSALPVPGAGVLCLAAGAGYGLWWGTLLACAACTAGATLNMTVARHLLQAPVRRWLGHRLDAVDRGIARDGVFYLFSLRMLPVIPYFVLNPLMGLTTMPVWTYAWVSYLGMLAGTAVYVNAGTQLAAVRSIDMLWSPPVIGALLLLGLLPWASRAALAGVRAWRR